MSKSNCRSRSCKPIVELVPKGDSAFVSAWRGVAVGGKREKVIERGTMRQRGDTREWITQSASASPAHGTGTARGNFVNLGIGISVLVSNYVREGAGRNVAARN